MPTASAPLPNRRHKYPPPDLSAFSEVTAKSAYWLGFLMADGCVTQREVILVLHRRDESHIRAFMEFVGCSDRPLRSANRGEARRGLVSSVALARQLAVFGLKAGHKPVATVPPELASSPDFWRGVVDGDGTLRSRAAVPQLSLVGYPQLIAQFGAFLGRVFADGHVPTPYVHSQSRAVRLVSVSGRHARRAVQTLYYDGAVFALPRKRSRAVEICRWEPLVRGSYPWERWFDGELWTLHQGHDYDSPHRLWESGRRAARRAGLRLTLTDSGSSMTLLARPGSGTSWRKTSGRGGGT
jgi:hypothetical protein